METVPAAGSQAAERVLPSSTVAFVFTDIAGSTVRWERNPEAMRADLRRHDELMRSVILAHRGRVFKTIGDAFCAVFTRIEDAVDACAQAQRVLHAEQFKNQEGLAVRMALHVGEAEERDEDYFGPTLNRVARLLAIAHGGQVLLSGGAAQVATGVLAPSLSLRDMGSHRLKDLTAPEQVFQLIIPGVESEFPDLRSLSILSNNLPQQTGPLIGRDEDVARIRALIEVAPVVTLSGAGGVGKTRCALQAGAELLDQYGDGVWFADLASLADAALVVPVIARLFEVQETPGQSVMDALVMQLKTKRALLIIDNCEHVIARVADVASAIVRSCKNMRILATSREALNISGESLYRMPSLSVPAPSSRLSCEEAAGYSAVALFEERGRSVKPKFSLTDENAATVADICRRLDGIPLAIELAAARLRLLTPAQLLQKLNERFRLLTGGDRTALPRHQTMRALIDWSYDLLTPPEQGVFRTISAFSGGFSIEAASMLCANGALDEMDVLAIISSLLDKSLLQPEQGEEQTRYRLLESTREYAVERLSDSGERESVLERHARLYAQIAEELDASYEDMPPAAWIRQAQADIENLRAALAWAFSPAGDALIGQRIAVTLPRLFGVVAPAEGLRLVNQALEHVTPQTPPLVVAGLHLAHASFASVFNQFNVALAAGQEAVGVFMTLTHAMGLADAQRLVGRSLLYLGRVAEGEALLKESLSVRQAAGSKRLGGILGDLAVARALRGDLQGARTLFAQATAMFEEGADASKMAITAATLAEAEFLAGDAEAAVHLAQEALDSARSVGRYRTAAAILGNISAYELELRNYERARLHAREALEICRDLQGDVVSVIFALQHLATATVLQGEPDVARAAIRQARAAGLAGFVDARLESLGIEREHTERLGYEKLVQTLRGAVTDDELQILMRAGGTWSDERALNEAMAI